jgi:hypothetical protein
MHCWVLMGEMCFKMKRNEMMKSNLILFLQINPVHN